jgi:hypothetical protein
MPKVVRLEVVLVHKSWCRSRVRYGIVHYWAPEEETGCSNRFPIWPQASAPEIEFQKIQYNVVSPAVMLLQVLDEVGIDAVTGAAKVPSHKASTSVSQQQHEADDVKDEEIQALLAQLRS